MDNIWVKMHEGMIRELVGVLYISTLKKNLTYLDVLKKDTR